MAPETQREAVRDLVGEGISREELYAFLSMNGEGAPVMQATSDAYFEAGDGEYRPCTSFQAGMFPYGDRLHCARYQMYSLMNVPGVDEEIDEFGIAVMDAGKDLERQIVRRWSEIGILLTGESDEQTRLEDPAYWLSGRTDGILDLRRWGWPWAQPVEVKGKDHDKILAMKEGKDLLDPYHEAQCMAYTHMQRLHHDEMFAHRGVQPAIGGTVLYVSRQRPAFRHAYYIPFDEEKVQEALDRLEVWRDYWLQGVLPERDPSWRWSYDPCGYCEFKRDICRMDNLEKVGTLEESNAARIARQKDPEWTLQTQRDAVAKRWLR